MGKVIDDCYEVIRELGRGSNSVVYKAKDRQNDSLVVVKLLFKQRRDAESILRFRKEAAIISKLSHPHIVKLIGYGSHEGSAYLAMELVEGENLNDLLEAATLSLEYCLDIIIQIAETLDYVHSRGIIHRDLKPKNIVVGGDKQGSTTIKIIDFCLARVMDLTELLDREAIVGTFSYMSPEQAGTLPVLPDERSDLYSLGIIFYELITGKVPFQGEDVSAILHQHIAKKPQSLKEIKAGTPEIIDQMVMKLLKKAPEERYQSAKGLLNDLRRIKEMLEKNKLEGFRLGSEDRAGKLSYLIRFIGRQGEVKELREDFGLSRDGIGRLSLVSGLSGLGKTRLINELHPYVEKSHGIFVSGKCNKYGATLPYSAFVEAMTEYVEVIKRKPAVKREEQIKKIKESLGELGGVITQFVPALAELIGQPPALVELEAEREKMRFFDVTQAFLNAVASKENPLVIFLDDLQWTDLGTIELLKFLVPQLLLSHILIIGSYREEEVAASHSLSHLLAKLREEKIPFREISLRPFTVQETGQMIRETFDYQGEVPAALLATVQSLAKGNPFYTLQMLRAMVDEQVIHFKEQAWLFNIKKMEKMSLPSTLVELVLGRIRILKPEMANILSFASVIGRDFNYEILASIIKTPTDEILEALDEAQRQMFIWEKSGIARGSYTFSHDKLREVLYEKLTATQRKELHEEIAAFLEENNRNSLERAVYDLTHHYYEGKNKEKALQYSIRAGDLAKKVYANEEVLRFYERALALLKQRGEKEGSKIWLRLTEGMGDAHCLLGEFDKAIKYYEAVSQFARTNIEKAKLCEKEGVATFEKGDLAKAGEHYTRGLKFLNIKIPESFFWTACFLLQQILIQVAHTFFPFIYSAHRSKNDELARLRVKILFRLAYVLYFSNTTKCLAVQLFCVNAAEHIGPSKELSQTYSTHAIAMTSIPLFKRALRYAQMSLAMAEQTKDPWAEAQSQSFLGLTYYYASQFDKSIAWLEKAVVGLNRLGDPWELYMAYMHLGYDYKSKSEFDKALNFFRISYDLASRVKDQRGMGQALTSVCETLTFKGEGKEVEENIKVALELSKGSSDALVVAMSLGDYAQILLHKGRLEEAVSRARESKKLIEKYFFRADFLVLTYLVLGAALLKLAERAGLDQAAGRKYLKESSWPVQWAYILSLSFKNNLGFAYRLKGIYACLRGQKKKGRKYFDRSIKILEQQGNKYELGRTLVEAGRLIDG
ncbi:protein kinase [Candidatus Margulisiibacteriota bacterium]